MKYFSDEFKIYDQISTMDTRIESVNWKNCLNNVHFCENISEILKGIDEPISIMALLIWFGELGRYHPLWLLKELAQGTDN